MKARNHRLFAFGDNTHIAQLSVGGGGGLLSEMQCCARSSLHYSRGITLSEKMLD